MNAPLQEDPAPRRFDLGDGLILIAASALRMGCCDPANGLGALPGRVSFWAEAFVGLWVQQPGVSTG